MKNYKGIFVFCEGPHDVAFISKVLKIINGYKDFRDRAISELPLPLNDYYKIKYGQYEPIIDNEDIVAPFLPRSVMLNASENTFIFLYPCGGIDNILTWTKELGAAEKVGSKKNLVKIELEKIKKNFELHLKKIIKLEQPENNDNEMFNEEPTFCFFVDADDKGAKKRFEEFETNYKENFNEKVNLEQYNKWDEKKKLGFYVFHLDDTNHTGSLEDILFQIVDNKDELGFFEKHYTENFPKSGEEAARLTKIKKASLTSAGQYKNAGSALSVIAKDEKGNNQGVYVHAGFLKEEEIKENQYCQRIAKFFQEVVP